MFRLLHPFRNMRKIDPRKFAIAPVFAGDNLGPLFTVTGKTAAAVNARQFRSLEGAVLIAPNAPVIQVIGLGSLINGTYGSQPLAVTTNNGG